ncbi:hypothetical protein ACV1C5_21325, partial [Aeromonas caviae]
MGRQLHDQALWQRLQRAVILIVRQTRDGSQSLTARGNDCARVRRGVVSENGIYGHSRFCNTDFDDKLAC